MKKQEISILIGLVLLVALFYFVKKRKHHCGCDKGIGDPAKCKCGNSLKQREGLIGDTKKVNTNNDDGIVADVLTDDQANQELKDMVLDKKNPMPILKGEEVYLKWVNELKNRIEQSSIQIKQTKDETLVKKLYDNIFIDNSLLLKAEKIYSEFMNLENTKLQNETLLHVKNIDAKYLEQIKDRVVAKMGNDAIIVFPKGENSLNEIKPHVEVVYLMLERI